MGAKEEEDQYKPMPGKGWTFRFTLITAVSFIIIPSLLFSLACLNAPSQLIKDFMNETEYSRTGSPMPEETIDSNFGLLVAVVGLGAIFASLTSSLLSDKLGRKWAIMVALLAGAVGSVLMALCEIAKSYELLFVGRTIGGIAIGWGLSMTPTYVMEMCEPNMKSAAGMANQLSQSTGVLVSQIFGYEEIMGNEDYWTFLIGFPAVLIAVQILLFPLCPESPRYLLVLKKDEEGAKQALRKIHGTKDVDGYFEDLRRENQESETDEQISIVGLFRNEFLRRPLMVAIAMGLHQNWCGTNAVLFFSTELFNDAGVEGKEARYATSGTGVVFVIGNIIASFLMPRFGRRTLFIAGTAGIGICSAVMSITLMYKDEVDALKYVNVVVANLVIASYALGPICVYWVILGEIFPHSARGAGFGVAILCAFVGFFTHSYALPSMMEGMGSYAFFVFTGIDVLMIIFCFMYMPETRNKTYAEIAASWATPEKFKRTGTRDERRQSMTFRVMSPNEEKEHEEALRRASVKDESRGSMAFDIQSPEDEKSANGLSTAKTQL